MGGGGGSKCCFADNAKSVSGSGGQEEREGGGRAGEDEAAGAGPRQPASSPPSPTLSLSRRAKWQSFDAESGRPATQGNQNLPSNCSCSRRRVCHPGPPQGHPGPPRACTHTRWPGLACRSLAHRLGGRAPPPPPPPRRRAPPPPESPAAARSRVRRGWPAAQRSAAQRDAAHYLEEETSVLSLWSKIRARHCRRGVRSQQPCSASRTRGLATLAETKKKQRHCGSCKKGLQDGAAQEGGGSTAQPWGRMAGRTAGRMARQAEGKRKPRTCVARTFMVSSGSRLSSRTVLSYSPTAGRSAYDRHAQPGPQFSAGASTRSRARRLCWARQPRALPPPRPAGRPARRSLGMRAPRS